MNRRAAAAGYRMRQVLWALQAQRELDVSEALAALNPEQRTLFLGMSRADQAHSLGVWRALQHSADDSLLQAALLHDVGKAEAGIRLWHRVVVVLCRAFAPRCLAWLAAGRPDMWRYPFSVYLDHAARGAERVQQTQVSGEVVELIRWHHAPAPVPVTPELASRLALLQEADSAR